MVNPAKIKSSIQFKVTNCGFIKPDQEKFGEKDEYHLNNRCRQYLCVIPTKKT